MSLSEFFIQAKWMSRILAGALIACHVLSASAQSNTRPNIVIFIADDLSWHDVACFGGPTSAKTPNLDRLASEGVKLTGFFSSSSVCAPTRMSLLDGLYPVRSGAYPNHSQVEPGTRSLPYYLEQLGYRTACSGKRDFRPEASFPFSDVISFVRDRESHFADLDFPAMEKIIHADPARPFCLYVASHQPHRPCVEGDRSAYDPAKIKLPPYLADTPETRQELVAYYAAVSFMDEQVGKVLELLEKTGHAQDALFLFFSEQGSSVPFAKWTCYGPGTRVAAIARWPGKISPGTENGALVQYEDVTPTLVAVAGGDPTTLDTGCPDAQGHRGFDGSSILDVLLGKTGHHRDYVFCQQTTRGIAHGSKAYGIRAVSDRRWELIVNLEPEAAFQNNITENPSDNSMIQSWRKQGESGNAFAARQASRYINRPAVELYDLQNDPWQLTNVAGNPENATTIARLRARLDAWMKQQGDEGDATERAAKKHMGTSGKPED